MHTERMTVARTKHGYKLAVRYPHEIDRTEGLYKAVRKLKGWTQKVAAEAAGIPANAWQYREAEKQSYRLAELVALKELAGLDWTQLGALIEELL
jgi:hypothetical protein